MMANTYTVTFKSIYEVKVTQAALRSRKALLEGFVLSKQATDEERNEYKIECAEISNALLRF
jgi:hypothetical protein